MLRAIFKNIKMPFKSYIDFDDTEMPIPYKFDAKMVDIRDPHV